ncbi:hypothetical protein BDA96_02G031200 [Sorghum bicolor]|uniref:Uncharacterized protein n=1 Tax=Sorghum bicolor TaxID=4558 RepID=A0A921RM60_SORBI|nr:hypothetical protein BDA96_02G031200 [Sorghum bicolor]
MMLWRTWWMMEVTCLIRLVASKSQKHNDTAQCKSRSSSPLFADVTLEALLHLCLI